MGIDYDSGDKTWIVATKSSAVAAVSGPQFDCENANADKCVSKCLRARVLARVVGCARAIASVHVRACAPVFAGESCFLYVCVCWGRSGQLCAVWWVRVSPRICACWCVRSIKRTNQSGMQDQVKDWIHEQTTHTHKQLFLFSRSINHVTCVLIVPAGASHV